MNIEIVDTNIGAKQHVSKFGVVITNPKKYMTGKQIMKYNGGEDVLKQYINQSKLSNNPNFKLCGNSKSDISKCKTQRKRNINKRKQKKSSKIKTNRSIQTSTIKSNRPMYQSMQTSPITFSDELNYNNNTSNQMPFLNNSEYTQVMICLSTLLHLPRKQFDEEKS